MADVRDYGVMGDGQTDDTEAIQHALDDGDGVVEFPRGDYKITRTLIVDLEKQGRTAIHGNGGVAKLVMHGPGPAIFLRGTHAATADPKGFRPEEWQRERMPTVSGIEIEGRHPEADGIRIEGVMQPTLTGVLIREVRNAVHVTKRARNVVISHCHLYNNKGIGVYFDQLNLHQAIIIGSHISYCRLGGIRIEQSEIRNLQITGNDIEYNNNRAHGVPDADEIPTAEIYIDVGEGSVREGTISSNTIQATYSKNGANIRLIGRNPEVNHKMGMWTISGNLVGSQETNIHLTSVREVTLTGNHVYSGHHRNLLVEDSRNIVLNGNCFGHNPDYKGDELCTGVRFVNSTDCVLSGNLIQDCTAGMHTVEGVVPIAKEGLLELISCNRLNLSGNEIVEAAPYGILLENCRDTLITSCVILDQRESPLMKAAICWRGKSQGSLIGMCRLGKGTEGTIVAEMPPQLANNLLGD